MSTVGTVPLHRRSATELAGLIAAHDLTSLEVAQVTLARIEQHDSVLNAWVYVDPEALLMQAETLDREARAGRLRGPLHGVPVGIKDIYDVTGMPTKAGSKVLADAPPAAGDSAPVALLRAAGAVIAGKTATTEFASADPARTVNPWDAGHTPGGSSSGSAAAVAARMVPAAMGSQTAGSVLRPASFCGIVGLKPSFGRVPREGVLPYSWSLDTVGPLTRTVEDAALMLRVLTPPGWSAKTGTANPNHEDRPPRLGYIPRLFPERLDRRMHEMLSAAAARLEQAGARVTEAALPADFEASVQAHHVIMVAEAAAFHLRAFPGKLHLYGPRIRKSIEAGALVPATVYLDAQRVRRDLYERIAPLLAQHDALLVPAAPGPAPDTLDFTGDPAFNAPWTMFGLPAITLPGGHDADGLPLGLQLVGRPDGDEALLDVAAWCERALGAATAPPAFA